MKRREFIRLLGGAAATWPLAARAQQPTLPVIGLISAGSRDTYAQLLAAFRQGLKETGYVEGQTVAIESRWADGQLDRLPRLAADLVQRRVAVIVTTGGSSSRAAMAASGTIPIVFLSQSDPINSGFVTSFNRPDGKATGMALLTGPLVAKRLEIVLQLAPAGARSSMYDARLPPCASRSGFQPVKYSLNILAVMAASRMSLGNAPSPT